MKAFIDENRGAYGVEPTGKVMQTAPPTYWLHAQRHAQPQLRADRAKRDDVWLLKCSAFAGDLQVYGVGKVWRQ